MPEIADFPASGNFWVTSVFTRWNKYLFVLRKKKSGSQIDNEHANSGFINVFDCFLLPSLLGGSRKWIEIFLIESLFIFENQMKVFSAKKCRTLTNLLSTKSFSPCFLSSLLTHEKDQLCNDTKMSFFFWKIFKWPYFQWPLFPESEERVPANFACRRHLRGDKMLRSLLC